MCVCVCVCKIICVNITCHTQTHTHRFICMYYLEIWPRLSLKSSHKAASHTTFAASASQCARVCVRVYQWQGGHAGKRPICRADRPIHIVGYANKQAKCKQMNWQQLHAIYRYNCRKIHKSLGAAWCGVLWHGASIQISSFNLLSIMKQLATFVAATKLLFTIAIIASRTTTTTITLWMVQATAIEARKAQRIDCGNFNWPLKFLFLADICIANVAN